MSLVIYPDSIFKQKAKIVTEFNEILHTNIATMRKVFNDNKAIGLGANMCGILQRIILSPIDDSETVITMINPEIIQKSAETQEFIEASLSFPGIEALIKRAKTITLTYQDIEATKHEITVTGFLATVIQHEIDYLNGIVFLDYLPKVKAKLLRDKMRKYIQKINRHGVSPEKNHHTHYHGGKPCSHNH
jgi:peptide deformylase